MAIIYRGAGAWGAGKGSNLIASEVDDNFWDLHGRVDTLETTPPVPEQIDEITLVGSQLTISLTDATVFGPFTLPRSRLNWRGEWLPATAYFDNDVISVAGDGIYMVLEDHTSAATFDPNEDLASGGSNPSYALMLAQTQMVMGGVFTNAGTTINPTLSQQNGYFRLTNAAGATFMIPADATEDFTVGSMFTIREMSTSGSGSGIFVDAPSGVALDGPSGSDFTTDGYGSIVYVKKVAADSWEVWGDI